MNPGAVRELAALDLLPILNDLPRRPIRGWSIHPASGPSFSGHFPEGRPGIAIDRSRLDEALLRRAVGEGVVVREGQQVVDLVRDGDRVGGVQTRGGERYHARLVIGCDGLRSVVSRRANLVQRPPKLRKLAITGHVRGAGLIGDEGELRFLPWGTVGIVRVANDVANVVLVLDGTFAREGRSVEASFDRLISQVPTLANAERLDRVYATGPFDCPTRSVAAEGVLLVGDAAGYFDPFTGQGIFRALKGARLAAEAAHQGLDSRDSAQVAFRRYAEAHHAAFGPGQLLQKVIEQVTRRTAPFALAARCLHHFPTAANLMVRLTGDVLAH